MRRALLSVLLVSFVLAGAAGLSTADQADQAVSELRADWVAAQSQPSSADKTIEMSRLRNRALSLARQYPENTEVQAWVTLVVSSHRHAPRHAAHHG